MEPQGSGTHAAAPFCSGMGGWEAPVRATLRWDRQSRKWDQRSGVNLVCDAVDAQHLPERLCAAVAQLPRPLPELVACGRVLTHCVGPAIDGAGTAAAPTPSSVTDAVRSRAGLEANMRWRPKVCTEGLGRGMDGGGGHTNLRTCTKHKHADKTTAKPAVGWVLSRSA